MCWNYSIEALWALRRFLLWADRICLRDRLSQAASEKRQEFRPHGRIACVGRRAMAFLLVESCLSLARKAPPSAFGIGLPLGIASASLIIGIILMFAARKALPAFFRRKAFTARLTLIRGFRANGAFG